jgi:DNA-binding CsgD family transcriptional regulator
MSWVWAIVAGVLLQYVLAEVLGGFLAAARWMVRRSARRLPLPWQRRYEAEWLAELEAVPGSGLRKLMWAAQLRAGAARTAQVLEDTLARRHETDERPTSGEGSLSFVPGPALTVRERQVAELAAKGLSDREIADALFLTKKTVEWHLRQVYRKMGR